jgi:hypothetical protein
MSNDWRTLLRQSIHDVDTAGLADLPSILLTIRPEISESSVKKFTALRGWRNAERFGDAPPETLRIEHPSRRPDGSMELHFDYKLAQPESRTVLEGAGNRQRSADRLPRPSQIIDFETVPELVFPIERLELKSVRSGQRHDSVVPIPPTFVPKKGQEVTFLESASDPFGFPYFIEGGEHIRLTLTDVRDHHHRWAGQNLYYIKWNPPGRRRVPAHVTSPEGVGE